MRIRVLPYRQGSRSARALADAIGGKVLRLEGSRFRPRPTDVIINWGNTTPYTGPMIMFNEPESIRNVSNKLVFFQRLKDMLIEDLIPPFWTNKDDIPDEDFPIVCRTVLAGHSGEGIVIADTREQLVDCPLYVKYIKKQDEYRIHVGVLNDGSTSIISQQRKARREDHENPNSIILINLFLIFLTFAPLSKLICKIGARKISLQLPNNFILIFIFITT